MSSISTQEGVDTPLFPGLTAIQIQIVELLSSGATLTAAAQQAGIHRNTIASWRRTSAEFQAALRAASEEKALYWREQAEELAAAALDTIRTILADPKAPASVRLKAALAILEKASTPPPPPSEPVIVQAAVAVEPVHKIAQSSTVLPAPEPDSADQPPRNALCPCGSGRKFKRCCLQKTPPGSLAA